MMPPVPPAVFPGYRAPRGAGLNVLLVQPPFVQLNAPYPAVPYLASFCRRQGHEARCLDLSIELFHRIFSAAGLSRVFAEAGKRLPDRMAGFDAPTRSNVLRYLSNADQYVRTIDAVVRMLSTGDDAFAHELAAARRVPWGHRAEGFLQANDGELGAADAPMLASLIIEDLADFIRFSLDGEFSLVRYGESKASSQPSFAVVEAAARDSFLFREFFRPLAGEVLGAAPAPDLVCVTVPFPGTLPGALVFAQEAKRAFGKDLPVAFGGGYVSTELRCLRDPAIFDYTDYLCYDAGYASLAALLRAPGSDEGLFKTIVRRGDKLVACGFDAGDREFFSSESIYEVREPSHPEELRAFDDTAIREVFPDFSGVDFSRCVRIVEGTNPMHALWSGAAWMKARLAYGCYWRRGAFCDTSLEYIARFAPSVPDALFDHLHAQSRTTGQRGVHFVDEAMPVGHLLRFGLANLRAGRPLVFWGNARLEGRFGEDACALLAEAGLIGLSFGLEMATESGLEKTRKGIDLASIVASLAALKRNGILAHAYLIYGWPGQSAGDIVDSMEIVRQLFAGGLLVSAFWHRFILTRHSPMYAEWRAGARPLLRVTVPQWTFGANDLSFEGEEQFESWGPGLEAALGSWMEQSDLDRPVRDWFDEKIPRPRVAEDHVEKLAAAAERRARSPAAGRGRAAVWLGGRLIATSRGESRSEVTWAYRNTLHTVGLDAGRAAVLAAALDRGPGATVPMEELLSSMDACGGEPFENTAAFKKLRRSGLAVL
jgi:radical SAM superfamily enzyme YgiQ (UPF0313 family)